MPYLVVLAKEEETAKSTLHTLKFHVSIDRD